MNRTRFVPAGLVVWAALLAGCATPAVETPIVLPEQFWRSFEGTIGVAMVAFPKGSEHMVGPQDALDKAIASKIDAPLVDYLATVEPRDFGKLAATFAERLRAKGYAVSLIAEPLTRSQRAALGTEAATATAGGDLASIRSRYGVDRLLLLSIDRFGAMRDYFVFVARGAPLATFQVRGELVDLAGKRVLWRTSMAEKQNVIPIEGEWSQPPDYPNLTRAIRRAEEDAIAFLESAFFSGAP